MPPLNPWLQRLLVAWAASTVTTGTLIATAENRYRPKKARKSKRKRPDGVAARTRPPALPGTVARADAAEGYTPSLTWAEWFVAVQARGQRLLRFVTGQPPIGSVDEDGSRLPDEVVTAGGQKVKVATTKAAAKKTGAKKRRGAATSKRRGRRQQRQATLYESAKESLRQVVKEEAQKAVDETVEEAGLGKARDALKTASEAVGKTAATVAEKVKESIPEDFDEKAKTAGRSLFAGAKRAMQKLGESLQALDEVASSSLAAPPPADGIDAGDVIDVGTVGDVGAVGAATTDPPAPSEAQVVDLLATMAALDGEPPTPSEPATATTTNAPAATATTTNAPAATAPTTTPPAVDAVGPPGAVEGLDLEGIADKVGDGVQKLGGGVQKLGAFLSGPGNPGYQGGGRRVRRAVGDVVEARDAPTPPAPPDDTSRG
jgi:hypothetical protein